MRLRTSSRNGRVATMLVGGLLTAAGLAACGSTPTSAATGHTATPTVDDAQVNQARYDCLLAKGFAVTKGADGSVSFADASDKLTAAFNAADNECNAKLVAEGLLTAPSAANLRAEYPPLSRLHQCLADAGFPLVDWMSEEVFLDRKGSFDLLESTAPIDEVAVHKVCTKQWAAVEETQ